MCIYSEFVCADRRLLVLKSECSSSAHLTQEEEKRGQNYTHTCQCVCYTLSTYRLSCFLSESKLREREKMHLFCSAVNICVCCTIFSPLAQRVCITFHFTMKHTYEHTRAHRRKCKFTNFSGILHLKDAIDIYYIGASIFYTGKICCLLEFCAHSPTSSPISRSTVKNHSAMAKKTHKRNAIFSEYRHICAVFL